MANPNLRIINCCPHEVAVYEGCIYDPASGRSKGGKEILRIPASGIVASARSSIQLSEPLEIGGVEVSTCKRSFAKISELPKDADCYIVSSLFAQAAKELGQDTSKLLTPYGTVINEDTGKTIGCTGLIRYA